MTDVSRGDGRLMSSWASRTAAMMDAAMTRVEANRTVRFQNGKGPYKILGFNGLRSSTFGGLIKHCAWCLL